MKKNYISPAIKAHQLEIRNSLLNASTFDANQQVGAGSSDNRVNFGRGGFYFEDEEE